MSILDSSREHSLDFLKRVTKALADNLPAEQADHLQIIVMGSYGRLEASSESDFDYSILYDGSGKIPCKDVISEVERIVDGIGVRAPSSDGAFGRSKDFSDLERIIGGKYDSNENITLRMLFLLESRSVFGNLMDQFRSRLVNRYISEKITDHQLAMFFLNDVIRYWRTICTDFEYKTAKEEGKSWGDRNIKLVYSRKLLYFSGIIVAAEAAQQTASRKREILNCLLSRTPIDRIRIVGRGNERELLRYYEQFLEIMSDAEKREALRRFGTSTCTNEDEEIFRRLKNDSHKFSWALLNFLETLYHSTHPIHRALIL